MILLTRRQAVDKTHYHGKKSPFTTAINRLGQYRLESHLSYRTWSDGQTVRIFVDDELDENSDTIKYIDPSYIIRSVPANASDKVYCGFLGQYAVHAAMAGCTNIVVAKLQNRYVHLPLELGARSTARLLRAPARCA
ncbi:hypothetical protein [Candidatus Desulfovibrio trichonymphae]|uniref:hypothetical protein n=1 Tax=Candidatus Desulfovibrio trichonymphae TaxID=1725232 RepID=UPI001E505D44|nr:hypothetical protein [Candidatus Desulfovibrio trichonymphae]